MRRRTTWNLFLLTLLCAFFSVLGIVSLLDKSRMRWPDEMQPEGEQFRAQQFSEEAVTVLEQFSGEDELRAKAAAALLLEHACGNLEYVCSSLEHTFGGQKQVCGDLKKAGREKEAIASLIEKWQAFPQWNDFLKEMLPVWADIRYFPVLQMPEEQDAVTFTDSWMCERSFGGKRGHEGTDLMTKKDEPGRYPAVSMTDGTVIHKGWLPKGGYRIGIRAPHGGYFYYAHLDSYAQIEEGDTVRAGQLIGFVGNSGYGSEGTKGKFATHLHVGIYLNPGDDEISVNPYWILKYLEEKKLTYTSH